LRIVIHGAGAVGGVLGARLHQHGHDVTLIARGEHLRALRERGLTLTSPDGRVTLPVPAVGHPSELRLEPGDLVLLAMKTQDTEAALQDLTAAGSSEIAVACAQNGVENERLALRRFAQVYGMMVWMPAAFLEPGVVEIYSTPLSGAFALGCVPHGTDARAERLAAALEGSGFRAACVPDVLRWKHAKLLTNLGNALEAAAGPEADLQDIEQRLRDEALACYQAAGIDWMPLPEMRALVGRLELAPVSGRHRRGGSSWQSLARGAGSIETDWLNGEIVLLGRLHGVPTPVNRRLQELAGRLLRERRPASSLQADELRHALLD
jgi:2-dehydropantoate 2-reductase